MDIVGLRGERVRLLPLERSRHLDNAYRWMNDPEITATLKVNFGVSRRQEEEFFDRVEGRPEAEFVWGIHDESGRHVGMIGLHRINWRLRSASGGLMLGERDAWGRGLATDAVRVRASFGFEQMGLHRIEGHTFNPAMRRVYQKCGYTEEGIARQAFWRDGRWRDAHLFAILDADHFGPARSGADAGIHDR